MAKVFAPIKHPHPFFHPVPQYDENIVHVSELVPRTMQTDPLLSKRVDAMRVEKMGRREVTDTLANAVVHRFVPLLFSCYREIGVKAWGRRRIDLVAINTKQQLIGIEIKSCVADYSADKKWREYLPYTDKFYFAISQAMWENKRFHDRIVADTKKHGVGIMVLYESSGQMHIEQNAKKSEVTDTNRMQMLIKLAWRGGESRYNVKRCKRFYLTRN